jgi:hypothetical protein
MGQEELPKVQRSNVDSATVISILVLPETVAATMPR